LKENNHILAGDRIGKLLVQLSFPAMIGMVVQSLYNVVDSIFVGRGVGMLGIAGIAIVFPIQMVMSAVAQMLGIGGASLISRSLGEGNLPRANRTFGNVLTGVIVIGAIFATLGNIFIDELLKLFGATDSILPYAKDYASIILFGSVLFSFAMATNGTIRAEGKAKVAMTTMLISAGLNTILDPIFIFWFGWGIKGAAWATVLSQAVTVVYLVYYFWAGKSILKLSRQDFMIDRKIMREIVAVGSASFFRMVSSSFIAVVANHSLKFYGGDVYIAIFGIINRLVAFVMMPMLGISMGVQPIAGYNFGAKRYDKARRAVHLGNKAATGISILGFLVLFLFPKALLSLFTTDQQLIEHGVPAMRIFVSSLPLLGFIITGGTLFQSIGKAKQALYLAVFRQICLIPLLLILPPLFRTTGIWLSFPITDVIFFFVTWEMYQRQMKDLSLKT